jgi:hypothetical protein
MVIATPSFILSGFTWPLSQMPVWVQAISMWFLSLIFWKLFGFDYWERNVFQTTGAIWSMVIIGTICGILSYIALYFKRKNVLKFKHSLKAKGIKLCLCFLILRAIYLFLDLAHAFHFLVCQESSDIFKMLRPFCFEFKNLCR